MLRVGVSLLTQVLIILIVLVGSVFATPSTYQYDNLYRLTRVERPDGSVTTYQYDEAGNRTRMVTTTGGGPAPYTLTLTKSGTGTGTVTSAPAGINCGDDCTEIYSAGISVVLTAVADGGSAFTGWGGACLGSGTCTVTMDGTKEVTATFSDVTAPTTTPSEPGGTYSSGQAITLNANEVGTIYYTVDGTDPTTSNTRIKYVSPISIAGDTILKYYAVDLAGNAGAVQTQSYVISGSSIVWQQTGGPEGGETDFIVVHPTNPQIVYAARGYLFKSTDGGASWNVIKSGLTDTYVRCLTIDPTNPQTIYAGTSTGVYKSTDGGNTWNALNSGLSANVASLAIDPTNPQAIYAGTYGYGSGLFKSLNGGASWTAANNGLTNPDILSLAIDPTNSQVVYAGTEYSGVFKSSNGAGSWSLTNGELIGDAKVTYLHIDPTNSQTVYAGTWAGKAFKSTNGGGSWSDISCGSPLSLAVSPSNPQILYAGTYVGVCKSTDGGTSWTTLSSGLVNSVVWSLAVAPSNSETVYVGTSSGASRSTNGGYSWTTVNSGLINSDVYSLAIDPTNPQTIYAVTYDGDVFKSTNRGVSWSAILTGLAWTQVERQALAIDPKTPQRVYVGTSGGLYRTTDGGGSWSAANNGLVDTNVLSVAADPIAPNIVYVGTSSGVFKSVDYGSNWSAFNSGLSNTRIFSLAVDPSDPHTIYAGNIDGGVFKTTNSGVSWSPVNTGLTNTSILSLAIDPSNPLNIYAGVTDGGVFKSANGGNSWNAINNGANLLNSTRVYALAIDPTNPQTVYAGSLDGVFMSSNGGASWIAFNSGLTRGLAGSTAPDTCVLSLAIDPTDSQTVYAGTDRGGVFKTVNSSTNFSLTLNKSGPGTGTITSSPSGINCGGTCTASYASGTPVALTATADPGSYFYGWSSPCSGNGTCSLTLTADTQITATFNPAGNPFIDVVPGSWAEPYINALYTAHITTGYGGTNEFKPDYEISREQMAGFIVRTKTGEPPADYCAAGSPFTDVAPSSWSCIYIKKLYDLGLTTGYGGTSEFKPGLIVTREQMAALVTRALEGEPSANYCDSGSPFTDVPPSSWSCKYIKRLYELGITTGYGGTNEFKPGLTVTRAQMAAFIGRSFLASPDTTPNPFTLSSQTNVALNTVVTSNPIPVIGINTTAPITIIGGEYSINGGAYTSANGTVRAGDMVTVRVTTSGTYSATATAVLTIGGVSSSFSVTTQAQSSMTPTELMVQKIYIAFFQRPAHPQELIYWAGRLDAVSGNAINIIVEFANTAESMTLYGAIIPTSISTVVDALYWALFDRNPDSGGLSYYVNGFNSGTFTVATIVLDILNGAQNGDLQTLNNKVTAANLFTGTIDPELDGKNFLCEYSGDADHQRARQLLATVTSDPATIPNQNQIVQILTNHTIIPTVGVDPISGYDQTQFVLSGNDFTPNSTATLHLRYPNSSETTLSMNIPSFGAFTDTWLCNACPVGQYIYWAVDNRTATPSNRVMFTVNTAPDPTPNPPSYAAYFNMVQKIYIGYFQRPADPDGLLYWAKRLEASGGILDDPMSAAFANSMEVSALYGGIIDSSNIGAFVDGIYMALFNRPSDPGGKDYYVNAFNFGQLNAAAIMLNILNGAQGEDLQMLSNKVVAANLFTRAIDPDLDGKNFLYDYSGNAINQRARQFLATVTSDPATIPNHDQIVAVFQ